MWDEWEAELADQTRVQDPELADSEANVGRSSGISRHIRERIAAVGFLRLNRFLGPTEVIRLIPSRNQWKTVRSQAGEPRRCTL
jgi:hypothetical protein